MRISLYLRVFILCSVVFISSCKKEPENLDLPYRKDVPVLLAAHTSSYDLREIHFSLDLAVFKGDNEINEVKEFTGLPDSSFKFEDYITTTLDTNTWVKHTIEKVEYLDTIPQTTFSTLFLIDQSDNPENFDSTDYYNQRFQAFNAFYRTLSGRGKVIFSSYNRKDYNQDVLKIINTEFSDNWDPSIAKSLLDLTHQQSGSSGLFDALEEALNFISDSNSENKSITLFIRNKDDGESRLDLEGIISLAKLNQVKINVIWLIHETVNVDSKTLRQLSERTGGFTVYMSSIYQSTTVFLNLAKLLRKETSFYRISAKLTIEEPNYFATKYSTGMYLYYYVSQFFTWSYVPLYLEKP
jgi:hypothetical protein